MNTEKALIPPIFPSDICIHESGAGGLPLFIKLEQLGRFADDFGLNICLNGKFDVFPSDMLKL